MTSSERVGHILVAIPIAHVLGASLYLWAYCTGFGAHLIAYASVSDILFVSVSDMVTSYLISFALPALLAMTRLQNGSSFNYFRDRGENDEAIFSPTKAMKRFLFYFFWLSALSSVVGICVSFIQWRSLGYVSYGFIFIYVTPLYIFLSIWLLAKLNIGEIEKEAISVIMIFAISLTGTGLAKGQRDRMIDYDDAKSNFTSCDGKIVIRRFGNLYLSIQPNNKRILLNENCEPKFSIPRFL